MFTSGGYLATDVGCADGTSAAALDAFFRERIGPVLGHDYQHVYPLGGDRHLWLFQDTFIDHTGQATSFDQTSFAHNTAMVQQGRCFTLLHRGTAMAPRSFEPGTGERILSRWFWPLGGELDGGRLQVFWAEMAKTADPSPPDGLGWVPVSTWLATYDAGTLARLSFQPAPASGVEPIYGFAVASDAEHTYLFGNSFDQNLARQGGYYACPCSATRMYLARVPKGALDTAPQFRTADGWSPDPQAAVPIVDRYHAENPMQPRFLDGRWVSVTKVDGYWGDELAIDVAPAPWGPWTTATRRRAGPARRRSADEHLPRPPAAVDGRRPRRQRVAERPRHAARRLVPPRPLPPAVLRRGDASSAAAAHEPVDGRRRGADRRDERSDARDRRGDDVHRTHRHDRRADDDHKVSRHVSRHIHDVVSTSPSVDPTTMPQQPSAPRSARAGRESWRC